MDTNKLKSYAQEARRELKQQISSKLLRVLASDSLAQRENPQVIKKLKEDIAKHSEDIIIEKVAYTWFNRIMALRFMDVNHYTQVGIVSPLEGNIIPEILADAKESHFDPDLIKEESAKRISGLLLGSIPSNNSQQEAYQIILINVCNYYHRLLPFLFEEITDYTELLLPDDLLSDKSIISKTRETLTAENCSQVEVIGWLYQFYISEKKDKVMAASKASKSNKSYKSEDIPAVTQLFTPHWIVQYMVENSLGRLWLENHPNSSIKGEMKYYIEAEVSPNHLKISSPEEITFIDPCCGSGHILVYAFDLLTKIYEEEGYNKADIAQLILEKNLSGIDIDKRAGDLASFALIMRARDYHSRFLKHDLSQPNIITMKNCDLTEGQVKAFIDALENPSFSKKTSTQATINTLNLQDTLTLLRQAETFGSLIQPKVASVEDIITAMEESELDQNLLYFETYQKLLTALQQIKYLQKQYHCVVTNPPYMGTKGMNAQLKDFVGRNYKDSKADLFACFMERCLTLNKKSGFTGTINQHSWMFLSSFEKLRDKVIKSSSIINMLHLGTRTFPEIGGEVVQNTAFILQNNTHNTVGIYLRLTEFGSTLLKSDKTLQAIQNYKCGWYYTANQEEFKKITGSPIAYWVSEKVRDIFANNPKLGDVTPVKQGMASGNNDVFLRLWSEINIHLFKDDADSISEAHKSFKKWFPFNKGGEFRKWYGNIDYLISFDKQNYVILSKQGNHLPSKQYYFKKGITWSAISSGMFSVRVQNIGTIFSNAGMAAFPEKNFLRILSYMNSKVNLYLLSSVSNTLNFNAGDIAKAPVMNLIFDKNMSNIDEFSQCNINISHQEWDSRETSWDFKQIELVKTNKESNLRQSYNLWVKQARDSFFQLHANEEELNRIFIDIYDLADEMDKFVDLEDITLYKNEASVLTFEEACKKKIKYSENTCNEAELRQGKILNFNADEIIKQFISYAVGCMLGRYTLDSPGLFIANQGQTISEAMSEQGLDKLTYPISASNVLPILEGDWFADDITGRFKDFLKISLGKANYEENLKFIEKSLGKNIEKYFVKDFYSDHIKRYKKRPIYWLFTSPNANFSALIYLHRYTKDTVSVVLNQYLREFQLKCGNQLTQLQHVSQDPTLPANQITRAVKEMAKLKKVIRELEDYERDTLYPLATRQIEIDLDDGVKVNYDKLDKALKKI